MNRGVVTALVLFGLCANDGMVARQARAQDSESPKSRAAREATARYERELMKAEADARGARAELRETYGKDLDDARRAALEQGDLDEAQRILSVKEETARPEPRLKIVEARFISMGDPAKQLAPAWTDVTKEIRRLVKNDRVVISLAPQDGDHLKWPQPASGHAHEYKYLLVVYSIDGDTRQGIVSHPQWRAEFPEPKKSR